MKTELTKIFTSQQYLEEILTLSNTEIDLWIEAGAKVLIGAEETLEDIEVNAHLYEEMGLTRDDVRLDIERIQYNLDLFTEAFMEKEKAMVIMNYDAPMFFHMN